MLGGVGGGGSEAPIQNPDTWCLILLLELICTFTFLAKNTPFLACFGVITLADGAGRGRTECPAGEHVWSVQPRRNRAKIRARARL